VDKLKPECARPLDGGLALGARLHSEMPDTRRGRLLDDTLGDCGRCND
jgi:hypothetical protein